MMDPPVRYEIAEGLVLQTLGTDEAARLAAIFAGIDPWRRYPRYARNLANYLSRSTPDAPRLALMREGVTVGAVGLRTDWLAGPYLQFIGIVPQHQAQGYGSAVLEWFLREAGARGARNAWICVSDFNLGARALYESQGFIVVGTLPDLVEDGLTELLLRKTL